MRPDETRRTLRGSRERSTEHWHGATSDNAMTHLALTEGDTKWGEHLTTDEYPSE